MKYMPTKVFMEYCRETEEKLAAEEQVKQNRINDGANTINETRNMVQEIIESANNKKMKFAEFSTSVKKSLLAEAVYKLFNSGLGIHEQSTVNNAIKINLVNSFINENGVDKLLSDFKYKSILLSEVSRIVTKYHKQVLESVDKDESDSYKIDPEIKDNFFEELDMDDFNDVSASIKTRVTDAVEEFIQRNIQDKEEIKDIIQDSKEKVLAAKTQELQEGFEQISKRKINNIRNSRKINIFEAMVRSLTKGVVIRDDLKATYLNEGKLDMDRIIESCKIMYTFLETLQTSKMVNIDEEYINNILLDLGK